MATPLTFSIAPKHLKDCTGGGTTAGGRQPKLTVKRTFTARNTGDLPVTVTGFMVGGAPCHGYGFKVIQCDPFTLAANASRKIDIAFTPDFTLSKVNQELAILSDISGQQQRLLYTLQATLPATLLHACSEAVPRPSWEPLLYYTLLTLLVLMLGATIIVAMMDADILIKENINNAVCQQQNQQQVFDLRSIASTATTMTSLGGGGVASPASSISQSNNIKDSLGNISNNNKKAISTSAASCNGFAHNANNNKSQYTITNVNGTHNNSNNISNSSNTSQIYGNSNCTNRKASSNTNNSTLSYSNSNNIHVNNTFNSNYSNNLSSLHNTSLSNNNLMLNGKFVKATKASNNESAGGIHDTSGALYYIKRCGSLFYQIWTGIADTNPHNNTNSGSSNRTNASNTNTASSNSNSGRRSKKSNKSNAKDYPCSYASSNGDSNNTGVQHDSNNPANSSQQQPDNNSNKQNSKHSNNTSSKHSSSKRHNNNIIDSRQINNSTPSSTKQHSSIITGVNNSNASGPTAGISTADYTTPSLPDLCSLQQDHEDSSSCCTTESGSTAGDASDKDMSSKSSQSSVSSCKNTRNKNTSASVVNTPNNTKKLAKTRSQQAFSSCSSAASSGSNSASPSPTTTQQDQQQSSVASSNNTNKHSSNSHNNNKNSSNANKSSSPTNSTNNSPDEGQFEIAVRGKGGAKRSKGCSVPVIADIAADHCLELPYSPRTLKAPSHDHASSGNGSSVLSNGNSNNCNDKRSKRRTARVKSESIAPSVGTGALANHKNNALLSTNTINISSNTATIKPTKIISVEANNSAIISGKINHVGGKPIGPVTGVTNNNAKNIASSASDPSYSSKVLGAEKQKTKVPPVGKIYPEVKRVPPQLLGPIGQKVNPSPFGHHLHNLHTVGGGVHSSQHSLFSSDQCYFNPQQSLSIHSWDPKTVSPPNLIAPPPAVMPPPGLAAPSSEAAVQWNNYAQVWGNSELASTPGGNNNKRNCSSPPAPTPLPSSPASWDSLSNIWSSSNSWGGGGNPVSSGAPGLVAPTPSLVSGPQNASLGGGNASSLLWAPPHTAEVSRGLGFDPFRTPGWPSADSLGTGGWPNSTEQQQRLHQQQLQLQLQLQQNNAVQQQQQHKTEHV